MRGSMTPNQQFGYSNPNIQIVSWFWSSFCCIKLAILAALLVDSVSKITSGRGADASYLARNKLVHVNAKFKALSIVVRRSV